MNLFLLRHGDAESAASMDSLRELSPKGYEDIRRAGIVFAASGFKIDLCFASPYLRAQQSAKSFLEASKIKCNLETCSILTPEQGVYDVIRFIDSFMLESRKKEIPANNLMLVGHNPLLSTLLAMLTKGKADYNMKTLATAELCRIEFEDLGAGVGLGLGLGSEYFYETVIA